MAKQKNMSYGIIGLGRLGSALAYKLYDLGADILVIDKDEERVAEFREITDNAFIAKNLTKKGLMDMGVQDCDVVIVCIASSIDVSILTVMKLFSIGVKRVIAKGGDTFYYEDGKLYLNGELVEEEYTNSFTYDFSLDNQRFATQRGALRYDEENDLFYVNEGYYFLMGDNRGVSNDSRQLGLFKEEQIVGVVKYELHGIFDWEKMR